MKTHNILTGLIMLVLAFALLISFGCDVPPTPGPGNASIEPGTTYNPVQTGKGTKDVWKYDSRTEGEGGIIAGIANSLGGSGGGVKVAADSAMAMPSAAESNIGFSVGGAKDINNFRENINNGYLPLFTDITYEGLFYDYYFDTGKTEECNELFCPSYTTAVSKDPFSQETEYFLSVGLNSGIRESDFARKKLNLVVVLDISGSMSSSFNRYYYDQFGNQKEYDIDKDEDSAASKMEVASKSVVALLEKLGDDDRFGMVLFDNSAYLANPLTRVGEMDMDKLRDHILELSPRGGTRMEAGMKLGTEQFKEYMEIDSNEYENRIIFLTDAMPNLGDTSEEGLLGITKGNAEDKIYSTFIGIGVDFNTELIEAITKIKGANYYSVHSSKEFKTRMGDEFEYMVTPLVFDLKLQLEADGYDILEVYGSPEAEEATGEIMYVNTLFPSKQEGGETRGGIIILKLRKTSEDASLTLSASYKDRVGNSHSNEKSISFKKSSPESFDNTGIRKGILLSRYTNLMKNWVLNERESVVDDVPIQPLIYRCDGGKEVSVGADMAIARCGIMEPPMPPEPKLSRWERQSVSLRVSDHYEDLFKEFKDYFEDEMDAIGDDTLDQEVDLMQKLINN